MREPEAAVYAYGHSQVAVSGKNEFLNNRTSSAASYPLRAGFRIDGNSEILIRGGQFSESGGPAILALNNSSVDVSGATFSSNAGGNVVCDSSSWEANNAAGPGPLAPAGQSCKVPSLAGSPPAP